MSEVQVVVTEKLIRAILAAAIPAFGQKRPNSRIRVEPATPPPS
jgi:hypothetical protein